MSSTNIMVANQRRIILDVLKGDNDYSQNNGILQKVLREFGHGVSLEKTNEQITWLQEKELVTVESLSGDLTIVKLTRKGFDVADGSEQIDGIERPAPGM